MKNLIPLFALLILGFQSNAQDISFESGNHQFDFWIGEWNVYKYGTDTIIGISIIESSLNHNAIEENYQSLRYKYKGQSLNTYDSKLNRWEQFYVDNNGLKLHLVGTFEEDKMILSDCNGVGPNCNRIIWTDLNDGTVRQEWQKSEDNGTTWKKVFDGQYKRRK